MATAVGRVDDAAGFVEDALDAAYETLGSREFEIGLIRDAAAEVTASIGPAREAIAGADASVGSLAESALTRRYFDGTAAFSALLDQLEETFNGMAETVDLAVEMDDLFAADETAWGNYEDFIALLNDDDFDAAAEAVPGARSDWKALHIRAETANETWPTESFDEIAEMLARQVDLATEMKTAAELGQDLDVYSDASVDAYNGQLDTMDAVKDEIVEWDLPPAYGDSWRLFSRYDADLDTIDEYDREFVDAFNEVDEMIESGDY